MGHLYLEHSLSNQSGIEVAGIRKDPEGLKPLDQPRCRFRLKEAAMEKEKIYWMLNRHFYLPDFGRDHDWKKEVSWQDYHHIVTNAIVPRLNTIENFFDAIYTAGDNKETGDWARDKLWEAGQSIASSIGEIERDLNNIFNMVAYNIAKAMPDQEN